MLGFRREALGEFDPEQWLPEHRHECPALTEENVKACLVRYMNAYGFDKAINHRGISSSRTVSKLTEWLWLLGDDEMVAVCRDDRRYPQYGVPILKEVARKYGIPIPPEIEHWQDGAACEPGCTAGCGQ
jgi:hypothetical protein